MDDAKTRLKKLFEVLKTNPNKLAKEIGMKGPQTLYEIRDDVIKSISTDLADLIIKKYPQLSKEYLKTGIGQIEIVESVDPQKKIKTSQGDDINEKPITLLSNKFIDGPLTIEDFRNVYQQGIIVAEAHRNFSIAAIKSAEADKSKAEADIERAKAETIKAEATKIFADTGKKQTDNNSELVGLLKKFFNPVSSEMLTGNVSIRVPIGDDLERMVMNGLGDLWSTVEEGRIIVGKLLASNAVAKE